MTPQEFKAWFDGFTEAIDAYPTPKQWERIKARVAEIDGKPVTEKVYVDRYLGNPPYWCNPPYRGSYWGIASSGNNSLQGNSAKPVPGNPGAVYLSGDAHPVVAVHTTGQMSVANVEATGTYQQMKAEAQINSVWDSSVAMHALGKQEASVA